MNVELLYTNADKFDNVNLLSFSFDIKGISRACLIELTRHRAFSFSVKSTRYTLKKELREEPSFLLGTTYDFKRAEKYVKLTGNINVDILILRSLENLRSELNSNPNLANDVIKYALPEAYKCDLVLTADFKGFKNFYELRSNKRALQEIQDLAKAMVEVLPRNVRLLVKGWHCVIF